MPTRDKDEGPAVDQSQAGGVALDQAVSEHRRKIIRASAAIVPAIMTIRSGAAVAMASINQCEERAAASAALLPESDNVVGDPDEWVRMEAWEIKVVVNDPKDPPTTLYGVPDNGVVPSLLSSYSVWYDEDGNTRESKNPYKEYIDVVKKKEFDAGKVVYLLCYVDAASGSYNWYPQRPVATLDKAASPINGSCLCSVNPDFTMG
ncbi:MAG: hypothetical protein QNL87_08260 [Gammaproteobacteria bacterium]|nr:hypothetical protein [Gammaproteobacteria bacterium]